MRCARTRENQVETQKLCGNLFQKELDFSLSIEKFGTSLNCELIKLFEEKRDAHSRLSETEHFSRSLLEEQENCLLSEARSELEMEELRVESADRALQESGLQLDSQRMELYPANHFSDHSMREELAMHRNWTEKKEFFRRIV